MDGEVRIVPDVPAAFCGVVADAWNNRAGPGFTMAVSGGGTASACYTAVAEDPTSPVDWMQTEIYWGDERCVPLDHPDSNYKMARETLLQGVAGVNALYPMRCDEGEDDAYHLLVSGVGTFDLVHLGVGTDGHTASLFPDSPGLDADPGRLVVRNQDPSGRNRHDRMTLTFAGIARARLAVVTISGPEKRDVVARLRAGEDLPANRIQADRVLWLIGEDAA